MPDNVTAAVIAGLATGLGLIILFALIFTEHISTYRLVLGNSSFEIPYRFTEGGRITGITMSVETLSITAKTDVPRDGFLEIHFPKKMLKELEIGSGYHYCVGNEFAVFSSPQLRVVVNDPIQPLQRENTEDLILSFPVKGGLQTLTFAGTDMLMTNPTCPS